MNIFVNNACALIAYLFDEVGSDAFEDFLFQACSNDPDIRLDGNQAMHPHPPV